MSASPLDAKEQIKQAIDIVELVERHVRLRRQGRNFVGLCPWHDDSRPSLQVNPERQSFKCWVCDIGGDVFTFVQKIEGVSFREALEMLAERAGISLQPLPKQSSGGPAGTFDKQTLLKAAAWAEAQYHACLLEAPEAEHARRYLDERGISAESIARFRLGFSPDAWDWIVRRARMADDAARTEHRLKLLEAIGILARPAGGGSPYDRFRGRLLFSIHDAQERPVGVGGRVVPQPAASASQSSGRPAAKYVNSPETPLFTKSQLLYGLDVARDAIRRGRTAVVMEGYTDVIMAHQYGFDGAVAVLGTALGEGHVRILRRLADRIVLVLDGDEAGQRRANEVLELFVAQQVDLAIVTLPEGLDPCDFLRERGAEALSEMLESKAVGALDHAFAAATRGLDLDRDLAGADRALERILSIIARAPRLTPGSDAQQQAREWRLLSNLAMRFRVPEETVRRRLRELRRRSLQRRPEAGRPEASSPAARPVEYRVDACEQALLELLLAHPHCFEWVRGAIADDWALSPTFRVILETSCRLADAGIVPSFDRMMLEFDDPAMASLLVGLDDGGQAKWSGDPDPLPALDELIRTLQRREVERRRPGQIGALREGGLDTSQETRLLEDILRQERSRQGISEPTDG